MISLYELDSKTYYGNTMIDDAFLFTKVTYSVIPSYTSLERSGAIYMMDINMEADFEVKTHTTDFAYILRALEYKIFYRFECSDSLLNIDFFKSYAYTDDTNEMLCFKYYNKLIILKGKNHELSDVIVKYIFDDDMYKMNIKSAINFILL